MKSTKVVFIVDDNDAYLKALGNSLSEKLDFPYRLYAFSSGKELLENMNLKPDIIVLDFFLGEETGGQLLHKIKKINPKILIVMLSVQDDVQVAVDILKLGAFDYIHKGIGSFLKVIGAVNRANEIIVSNRHIVINKKKLLYVAWGILIIGLLTVLLVT